MCVPQPTPTDDVEPRHMDQLDSLRALAVLAVFAQHALTNQAAVKVFGPGQYGVFLFFVLSGYLITGILLRCRDAMRAGQSLGITLRQFYARRFLRIVPVFYLVLGLAALANMPAVRETFWWHAAYLSNFYFVAHGDWNGPVTPFWTLAIEEQFYLVWPWVVLLIPRSRLRAAIASLLVLCPLARWLFVKMGGAPFSVGLLPFGNTDYLVIGALLAELQSRGVHGASARRLLGRVGLCIGLPLYALTLALPSMRPASPQAQIAGAYFQLLLSHLALGLFFFWLVDRASTGFGGVGGRVLVLRPLRFTGKISYGIYVYHTFVILALVQVLTTLSRTHPDWYPRSDWSWLPLRLGVLIGVATVSWYCVEHPINALKRHFPYRLRRGSHGSGGFLSAWRHRV